MNKEKILKEFEGKRIKDQGILPEGYKTGWNDCIDELVLDKVSDLIDQAEKELKQEKLDLLDKLDGIVSEGMFLDKAILKLRKETKEDKIYLARLMNW